MSGRIAAFAATVAACAALVACTTGPTVTPPAEKTAAGTSTEGSPVSAMSAVQRRSMIASNFPLEVPVPMGEVVRAEAQGDTAWDYEVILPADPVAVATWYVDALRAREWQVESQTGSPEGELVLTLTKRLAQTRVTIAAEPNGKSRAKVILGVGTSVLQTQ